MPDAASSVTILVVARVPASHGRVVRKLLEPPAVRDADTYERYAVTEWESPLPEVRGNAVNDVSAQSVSSIAASLERMLALDERCTRVQRIAPERARLFSWWGFAEPRLEGLEGAASRP